MRLPTERQRPRAITASATRLTRPESDYSKRLKEGWQERTFWYYNQIGEVNYAAKFFARQLQSVRFFPAYLTRTGDLEEINEGLPLELLNRVQDPGGGRSDIQFNYGRLMFLPGEGVLFARDETENRQEAWFFLWREEVKIFDSGRAVRLNAQKMIPDKNPEYGTAYRFWTPSAYHSHLADSPMRSVLDICEELVILTASVRSTAVTRLTNGILAIAAELSPPPSEPGHDEDPEQNIFLSDFMDHVQSQIENPGSAEAAVPFMFEGSYDYMKNGEGIQWIKTHDPATDYMERDLRVEALKRLALSWDFPPEALLGMTDANHWTAKQVEYDKRVHVIPYAERFAGDLNDAYLRPSLRDANFDRADEVVIGVDYSQIKNNPDSSADAQAAMDRGLISDEGARAMMGIPEKWAPSEEEEKRYLAIKLRDPLIIGEEAVQPATNMGPVPTPDQNGNAADGPPPPTKGRAGSRQEARTAAVLGAAGLALRQCRARGGARLRRHVQACDECQPAIDGKPNSVVASALGEQTVLSYVDAPMDLVRGGADVFREELSDMGLPAAAIDLLAARVEAHAAATLYEREPGLPPGFASVVEEVTVVV